MQADLGQRLLSACLVCLRALAPEAFAPSSLGSSGSGTGCAFAEQKRRQAPLHSEKERPRPGQTGHPQALGRTPAPSCLWSDLGQPPGKGVAESLQEDLGGFPGPQPPPGLPEPRHPLRILTDSGASWLSHQGTPMSPLLLGHLDAWGLGSGPQVQDCSAPRPSLVSAGRWLASSPAASCCLCCAPFSL